MTRRGCHKLIILTMARSSHQRQNNWISVKSELPTTTSGHSCRSKILSGNWILLKPQFGGISEKLIQSVKLRCYLQGPNFRKTTIERQNYADHRSGDWKFRNSQLITYLFSDTNHEKAIIPRITPIEPLSLFAPLISRNRKFGRTKTSYTETQLDHCLETFLDEKPRTCKQSKENRIRRTQAKLFDLVIALAHPKSIWPDGRIVKRNNAKDGRAQSF